MTPDLDFWLRLGGVVLCVLFAVLTAASVALACLVVLARFPTPGLAKGAGPVASARPYPSGERGAAPFRVPVRDWPLDEQLRLLDTTLWVAMGRPALPKERM